MQLIPLIAASGVLGVLAFAASQSGASSSVAWPLIAPMIVLGALIGIGLTEPQFTALAFSLCAAAVLAYISFRFPNDLPLWSVAVVVPLGTVSGEVAAWGLTSLRRIRNRDRRRAQAMEQLASGLAGLGVDTSLAEVGSALARAAAAVLDSPEVEVQLHRPENEGGSVLVGRKPSQPDRRLNLASDTTQLGTILLGAPNSPVDPIIHELFARQVVTALERHRQLRQLDEAAHRDPLTGTGNRRHAELLLARLRPGDGLALVDIDHFKTINDTVGHRGGDDVLVGLGQFLSIFGSQLVSRYGGDEFLVVIANCDDLQGTANRLIKGWREVAVNDATISVGVSVHQAGRSAVDTLEAADRALYRAKGSGRDNAAVEEPTTATS